MMQHTLLVAAIVPRILFTDLGSPKLLLSGPKAFYRSHLDHIASVPEEKSLGMLPDVKPEEV